MPPSKHRTLQTNISDQDSISDHRLSFRPPCSPKSLVRAFSACLILFPPHKHLHARLTHQTHPPTRKMMARNQANSPHSLIVFTLYRRAQRLQRGSLLTLKEAVLRMIAWRRTRRTRRTCRKGQAMLEPQEISPSHRLLCSDDLSLILSSSAPLHQEFSCPPPSWKKSRRSLYRVATNLRLGRRDQQYCHYQRHQRPLEHRLRT